MEERNDVKSQMDAFIAKKELLEGKIQSRTVALEVQTGNMTELYAEQDLIMKSLRQFVNINFCVEFLNGT